MARRPHRQRHTFFPTFNSEPSTMSCEATCKFQKLAEMGNEIMKETAKALGLSEAATLKMEEFYKKTYETMKEKGECPDDKTDEEKKKFMEESIAAIQADVDEADRELVAKVVAVSYEAIQKKKAEIAAADQ